MGNVQSGHARETIGQEVVPEMQIAVFTPFFDFPITFLGSPGEIHSNHFRGGLDFKIGGVIGKPMHVLADGHISRIRVTCGSGYVFDMNYDSGYSTISHHLNAFIGNAIRRMKELRYEEEGWEVEIIPEPGEYPTKTGQVIILSGDTGYSFGPYPYLDMIESATGSYIDPLPFFMEEMKDSTAPYAEGIILFLQPGRGVASGKQTRQTFLAGPAKPIMAWGLIEVRTRIYDYMDGVGGRCGVHIVILEVDGTEVSRSVVDRFTYGKNRYTNSQTHGQYVRSFVEPGNRLHMLHASNGDRGLVEIDEGHPYRLIYTLNDALGNTSKIRFIIQGKNTAIRPVKHREKYVFKWDKTNYLQELGLELTVSQRTLYDDTWLNYSVHTDSGNMVSICQLDDTRAPMHGACEMRIGLRHDDLEDRSKYYVAGAIVKSGKYDAGEVCEDGFMKIRIQDLATHTVVVNTVPPETIPFNPQQWGRTDRIVFRAKDKGTEVNSYRGTINGRYALFGKPNSISGNLAYKFDPKHAKKSNRHIAEMTITDGCGN